MTDVNDLAALRARLEHLAGQDKDRAEALDAEITRMARERQDLLDRHAHLAQIAGAPDEALAAMAGHVSGARGA